MREFETGDEDVIVDSVPYASLSCFLHCNPWGCVWFTSLSPNGKGDQESKCPGFYLAQQGLTVWKITKV